MLLNQLRSALKVLGERLFDDSGYLSTVVGNVSTLWGAGDHVGRHGKAGKRVLPTPPLFPADGSDKKDGEEPGNEEPGNEEPGKEREDKDKEQEEGDLREADAANRMAAAADGASEDQAT